MCKKKSELLIAHVQKLPNDKSPTGYDLSVLAIVSIEEAQKINAERISPPQNISKLKIS